VQGSARAACLGSSCVALVSNLPEVSTTFCRSAPKFTAPGGVRLQPLELQCSCLVFVTSKIVLPHGAARQSTALAAADAAAAADGEGAAAASDTAAAVAEAELAQHAGDVGEWLGVDGGASQVAGACALASFFTCRLPPHLLNESEWLVSLASSLVPELDMGSALWRAWPCRTWFVRRCTTHRHWRAASQACGTLVTRGARGAGWTCAGKAAVRGAAGRYEGEHARCQERAGGGCQAPDALPLPATQPSLWAMPWGVWAVWCPGLWESGGRQPRLQNMSAHSCCVATPTCCKRQGGSMRSSRPPLGYVDQIPMTEWVLREGVQGRAGRARAGTRRAGAGGKARQSKVCRRLAHMRHMRLPVPCCHQARVSARPCSRRRFGARRGSAPRLVVSVSACSPEMTQACWRGAVRRAVAPAPASAHEGGAGGCGRRFNAAPGAGA